MRLHIYLPILQKRAYILALIFSDTSTIDWLGQFAGSDVTPAFSCSVPIRGLVVSAIQKTTRFHSQLVVKVLYIIFLNSYEDSCYFTGSEEKKPWFVYQIIDPNSIYKRKSDQHSSRSVFPKACSRQQATLLHQDFPGVDNHRLITVFFIFESELCQNNARSTEILMRQMYKPARQASKFKPNVLYL